MGLEVSTSGDFCVSESGLFFLPTGLGVSNLS